MLLNGRAGPQGLQGLATVPGRFGLAMDEGMVGGLREDGRSQLPASVAVDAGGVHEEVAGDVLRDPLLEVRHCSCLSSRSLPRGHPWSSTPPSVIVPGLSGRVGDTHQVTPPGCTNPLE